MTDTLIKEEQDVSTNKYIDSFYYVTAGTGEGFLRKFTIPSIKSLVKTRVFYKDIHVVVNTKQDKAIVEEATPKANIHRISEDLKKVKWKIFNEIRKYSLFKAAALHKVFPEPIPDRCMIYFDGDVLWYKNPRAFFKTKSDKTWFHHGKELEKRARIRREDVRMDELKKLEKWISLPCAYLMVKHGATKLPDREAVAGLYLLHPRDHKDVLRLTYQYCLENADRFVDHEGAGDQKPMNAALNVLEVDWHGGSRFFCPEHEEYFNHYFGKSEMKKKFKKKAKELKVL